MFCRNCEVQISDDSKFCPYCGKPVISLTTPEKISKKTITPSRLVIRQSDFSDRKYYVFDQYGNKKYLIKSGVMGKSKTIYNLNGTELASVEKERIAFVPTYTMYRKDNDIGTVKIMLKSNGVIQLNYRGWKISGSIFKWNYDVVDSKNNLLFHVHTEILRQNTYVIDLSNTKNEIPALLIVLAANLIWSVWTVK